MIIIWLTGGVGNQLFQYAFGRRIALDRSVPLKLDLVRYTGKYYRTFTLPLFSIEAEIATPQEIQWLRPKGRRMQTLYEWIQKPFPAYRRLAVEEVNAFEFDPAILRVGRYVYLKGYWQTYKWFEPINSLIQQELTLKAPMDTPNQEMANRIADSNAVSVHFRRGDYANKPGPNSRFGVMPLDYYQRAIERIRQTVSSPHFFIFSDEPDWVEANFQVDSPMMVVRHNGPDKDYEDLRLMSLCRHHIIANSTFSWWGAWLGHNPEKQVVAPARWYLGIERPTPDLIPEAWHCI